MALDAKIVNPTRDDSIPSASDNVCPPSSQETTKQDTQCHSAENVTSTRQRRMQSTILVDSDDEEENDGDDDYIATPPRNFRKSRRLAKTSTPSISGPKMKLESDPSVKTMEMGEAPKLHKRSTWWEYVLFSNDFHVKP
jgi:hypothetical protein